MSTDFYSEGESPFYVDFFRGESRGFATLDEASNEVTTAFPGAIAADSWDVATGEDGGRDEGCWMFATLDFLVGGNAVARIISQSDDPPIKGAKLRELKS